MRTLHILVLALAVVAGLALIQFFYIQSLSYGDGQKSKRRVPQTSNQSASEPDDRLHSNCYNHLNDSYNWKCSTNEGLGLLHRANWIHPKHWPRLPNLCKSDIHVGGQQLKLSYFDQNVHSSDLYGVSSAAKNRLWEKMEQSTGNDEAHPPYVTITGPSLVGTWSRVWTCDGQLFDYLQGHCAPIARRNSVPLPKTLIFPGQPIAIALPLGSSKTSKDYYHWLSEEIPRLAFIPRRVLSDPTLRVVVDATMFSRRYVRESLALFGLMDERLVSGHFCTSTTEDTMMCAKEAAEAEAAGQGQAVFPFTVGRVIVLPGHAEGLMAERVILTGPVRCMWPLQGVRLARERLWQLVSERAKPSQIRYAQEQCGETVPSSSGSSNSVVTQCVVLTERPINAKGLRKRGIINSAQLSDGLEQLLNRLSSPTRRYRLIRLANLPEWTILEQILLYSRATVLMGPHGAGLTNLMLMPSDPSLLQPGDDPDTFAVPQILDQRRHNPRTTVIEFMVRDVTAGEGLIPCFLLLAGQMRVRYSGLWFGDVHWSDDLTVDVDETLRVLERALQSPSNSHEAAAAAAALSESNHDRSNESEAQEEEEERKSVWSSSLGSAPTTVQHAEEHPKRRRRRKMKQD